MMTGMLSCCGSGVGTVLSFLKDKGNEPAKREPTKLDGELRSYGLPDAPKDAG
jgi:hypothetical protein